MRDILVFDRVLNIVRIDAEAFSGLSGADSLVGKHLSSVVDVETCHDIIEWWASGHEQGAFKECTLDETSVISGVGSAYRLEPLLLPDGRAEHVVLSVAAEAEELPEPLTAALLDEGPLENVAGRIIQQLGRVLAAHAAILELYRQHTAVEPLISLRSTSASAVTPPGSLVPRSSLLPLLMKREHAAGSTSYYFPSVELAQTVLNPASDLAELGFPGTAAAILIPVRQRGQLFGYALFATGLGEREAKDRISAIEAKARLLFSNLLSVSLLSGGLSNDEQLSRLKDVISEFLLSLERLDFYQAAVKAVLAVEPVESASFYTLVGEELIQNTSEGTALAGLKESQKLGKGPVGEAAFTLNSIRHEIVHEGSRRYLLAMPVKSVAILEGEKTETVAGVLYCESATEDLHDDRLVLTLEILVSFAALANDNNQLMERSLQLLSDKSEQARMLEEKKQEMDEFIHTVTHDLKNPLSNIDGFNDLLAEELRDGNLETMGRYIGRIRSNIKLVMRLLSDLRELSQIGRIEHEMATVDLRGLVKEILFDFQHSEKNLSIQVDLESIPGKVRANEHRLTEVFHNILGNSIKYADPLRPPEISIECDLSDGQWHFAVRDNGIGVSPDKLEEIFNFGSRLKENKAEGTGAGLAICRKIITIHGGSMWAESEKGVHTTIHFTLPAAEE